MSSWAAELRRREAARKREAREAQRLYRELERDLKERARLSELAQARLEVAAHEHAIAQLASIHKEQAPPVEWAKLASALPPHKPTRTGLHEFAARLSKDALPPESPLPRSAVGIKEACRLDEESYQAAHKAYLLKTEELLRLRFIAKWVLEGVEKGYADAISDFEPFVDIPGLKSVARLIVHAPKLIEFMLTVSGPEIIPAETKMVTGTGKLSIKAMPKGRAQDLYQDYVCGCVLRVARELLALLPVDTVAVTASVEGTDERTGNQANLPVLAVAVDRAITERLNFERLHPSEALHNFVHRGDAKATRRTGELLPITPFAPQELIPRQPERMDVTNLLTSIRQLRAEIGPKVRMTLTTDDVAALQEAVHT